MNTLLSISLHLPPYLPPYLPPFKLLRPELSMGSIPVRVLKVRRCARTAGGGAVIVVGPRAVGGRSLAVPKGRLSKAE